MGVKIKFYTKIAKNYAKSANITLPVLALCVLCIFLTLCPLREIILFLDTLSRYTDMLSYTRYLLS